MGRKRIYKNDAERKQASRQRQERAGIKEPAPWIIHGVAAEIRQEIAEIAEERRSGKSSRSNIGHVVTDYLSEALKNNLVDMDRLYALREMIFHLMLDLHAGRSFATGANLEKQVEDIFYEIADLT
jgi:hypothetical protein